MACPTPMTEIMRFADAELPPEKLAALEQHIASCPECAVAVAEAMMLKRSVSLAGQRYAPSAELRSRVRSQLSESSAGRRASSRRIGWLWPIAVAAMVLLFGVVSLRVLTNRSVSQQLVAGAIDRHVAALASANQVDVVSTDRHTVKPWFQGRIPFSLDLPDLAGTDFTLIGGRVAFQDGSPGAQLIYGLRKHEISVFIFQNRDSFARLSDNVVSERSYVVENWKEGDLRYIVIADVPQSDVNALVALLKNAARH